ncbi:MULTISPECIES: zinc-binding dehydrogenase [unclassified Brachybacterium]|uniref:zinc-binding dehydrogenase n=1 Tax=unclassified Brachybacterium TaxID=2623841 RepID=UPI00362163AC
MTETPQHEIPRTMQAVVMHAPEDYRLEELEVPEPGDDELLIRVEAVGVCASDLKCYHGAAKFWGDENRDRWVDPGITPGHELVGEVVSGSAEALAQHGVQLGDRIACEQIVPCGECMYCQRGWYWMCGPHDMFGFKHFNGAMAEYMLVPPQARAHQVSKEIPAHHAAFSEPLSCSLHAVERAQLSFDDVVVVAGCGPIGLGAIIGAAHKNPKTVIALDFDEHKLELARKCGADLTLNPSTTDIYEEIRGLTGGYGADVYIECTGHPSAVGQGLNLLRKLGTYVEYSVFKEDVKVDWSIISDDKELDVLGAHLGPNCWPAAIKMIESGELPMDEICTHQYGLGEVQTALDQVADSAGASVKVSILPGI